MLTRVKGTNIYSGRGGSWTGTSYSHAVLLVDDRRRFLDFRLVVEQCYSYKRE